MPQTYIRAVGPGAVGRTCPVAVSCSRSGSPVPGRSGIVGSGPRRARRRSYVGDGGRCRAVRTAARGSPATPRPGNGSRPSCSSRSTRRRQASTSAGETQLDQRSCPASSEQVVPRARSSTVRPRSAAAARPPSPTARCAAWARRGSDTPWSTPCTGAARLDQDVAALAVGVVEDRRRARSSGAAGRRRRAPSTTGSPSEPRASSTRSQPVGQARRRHHVDQRRRVVVDGVDPQLAPCPGRTAPRAARSAARRPTRWPPTPRRPRPRGRPACRPGSPTAAAPPRPACRRSGRLAPSWQISQNSVALDASTSRPSTADLAVRARQRRAPGPRGSRSASPARRLSGGSRWRAGRRARRRRAGRRRTGTAGARPRPRPGPG